MAAHTTLMDFHVDSSLANTSDGARDLRQKFESALREFDFKATYRCERPEGGFLALLESPMQSHASLRCYPNGLVTLTLEEPVRPGKCGFYSLEEKAAELEKRLRAVVEQRKKSRRLPYVKRGGPINVYATTSDNRLLEYDFDALVYEADSEYQNIKIFHSISFGNLLVLDELQNLAESDLIYTQTLMRHGQLDYAGKTVLILGGGDGGLLHEMLKEKPAFVTMIEIDRMVMDACKKHLRSVCGTCLDTYETSEYEIIVDDCFKVMERYVEENKQFDFVFGDLTDIPITPTPQGEFWDFIRRILDLSFRILAPNGKFLTHGNGVGSRRSLMMYEEQLEKLHCPVEFAKHAAFVPSFMECWAFYEVWKKPNAVDSSNGEDDKILV